MQENRYKLWLRTLIILMCLSSVSISSSFSGSPKSTARPAFYETLYFVVNASVPPFNNVFVRYALAMSTDRQAITAAMREEKFKYFPGSSLVPPYEGYKPLSELEVEIESSKYDLLSYNPKAAKELLAKAGFPEGLDKNNRRLAVEMLTYSGEDTDKLTEIVKRQWQQNLRIDVIVVRKKWHDYLKAKNECDFKGVALNGKALLLASADNLLDFATSQVSQKQCWMDEKFDRMLKEAGRALSSDKAKGNWALRDCEIYLLRSMPVIPLYSRAP